MQDVGLILTAAAIEAVGAERALDTLKGPGLVQIGGIGAGAEGLVAHAIVGILAYVGLSSTCA